MTHKLKVGAGLVAVVAALGVGSAVLQRRAVAAATGGQAPLIARASKHIEIIDEYLTLVGLRIVWERNHAAKRSSSGASEKTPGPVAAGQDRKRQS